jgi:hypothetical protein
MRLRRVVIVHFEYGKPDGKPFLEFEKTLESAVNSSGIGSYDGNELAADGRNGTLYMYGPDADKLFALAKPILLSTTLGDALIDLADYWYGEHPWDSAAQIVALRFSRLQGFLFGGDGKLLQQFESCFDIGNGSLVSGWAIHEDGTRTTAP